MSWIQQFSFVMRSNITAIREKIEDPERMLHQLICDMEEELNVVRQSVAAAIADEIQLGKEVEKLEKEIKSWEKRASTALQNGNETTAKQALEQKLRLEDRLETIRTTYDSQSLQVAKLQDSYRDLENKIQQARHKRTLLVARLAQAESKQKINNVMEKANGRSAFAEFSRLEQRVERAENLSDAYDRLDGKDLTEEALKDEFEQAERKEKLESAFDELKARLSASNA